MALRARFQLAPVLLGLLWALANYHRTDGAQITDVSYDTRVGQVLVKLDNGLKGRLCFLAQSEAPAVCTVLWGKYRNATLKTLAAGAEVSGVVAALRGCDRFKPDNTGGWNLNNDCDVMTGTMIPNDLCRTQRLGVDCTSVAELRHGRTESEGLVLTSLSGSISTVCSNNVGIREAAAVCRTLGYPTKHAIPLINRYQPVGNFTTLELQSCDSNDTLSTCKWKSSPSPNCLLPSNQLSVSCSTGPSTTKPWPSPTLNCFRQQANICFSANSLTNSSDLELDAPNNSTECDKKRYFEDKKSLGQLCLVIKDYASCSAGFNDTHAHYTEYKLVMKFRGEYDDLGNFIRPPLNFVMYCEINKESLATGATIRPDFTTPGPLRNSSLNGVSEIEFYEEFIDGNLDKKVTGGVRVGMNIFAAVILKYASSNSLLVLRDCLVTNGVSESFLVKDKCPRGSNVLLIPVNDTLVVVNFKAFLMNGSSQLNMQCRTVICHKDDPSDECSRACNPRPFRIGDGVIWMASNRKDHQQRPEYQLTPLAALTVLDEGNSCARWPQAQRLWILAMLLLISKFIISGIV